MVLKFKYFFLLFVLFVSFNSYSQIVYDFSKKTKLDIEYFKREITAVKNGDFIIFNIENVNTFRYKVTIEGRSIDYVTPVPSELQTLFRLPKEEVTEKVQSAQEGAANIKADTEIMQKLSENANKISEAVTAVAIANAANTPAAKLADPQKAIKTTSQAEAAASKAGVTVSYINGLRNNQLMVSKEFSKIMEDLVKVCEAYSKRAQEVADIKFTRMLLINRSKQKWNKHSEMLKSLPIIKSEKVMKKTYLDFVKLYFEAEVVYKKARLKAHELQDNELILNEITHAEESVEKGYEKLEETAFLVIIDDVITLGDALKNENYFEVTSPPIQMDGDFVEFKVNITPEKVNDLMPFEQAIEFKVQVPGKGGWRADFSIGPTLSFGSGAKNESFYLDRMLITDSDGKLVFAPDGVLTQENDTDVVKPGIAAMIHAYKRSGKEINWGPMLGVGAGFESFDDIDASLYIGLSLVVGKKEKFMLSGGLSFLRVNRLKGDYTIGETYTAENIDLTKVTQRIIKPSGFISLSYAIGTKIEIQ